MANFLSEGRFMAHVHSIHWRVEPVASPRPIRHCGTCGGNRPFISSGKVRLNANGRRLDAWLIYKCETCDRTWNLPLVERASVAAISEETLQALHHSDPAWIRDIERDLALLGRHCHQIDIPPEVMVTADPVSAPEGWSQIEIVITAPPSTAQRLDRLLAHQLGLARSELQAMWQEGGLVIDGGSERALRKPLGGGITVRLVADRIAEGRLLKLAKALGG